MEENPLAKFQHEPDLIDILWRQDVDLGVEREIFDGCLRQREEDARRARESEQKRERELERVMQRLQKLDKETGEFLPNPLPVNTQAMPMSPPVPTTASTQHSPVTQNPLLSALLFSKTQKLPSEEQDLSELLSLPDLQLFLDLLASESPSLPLDDVTEICSQNISEPQRKNSTDEFLTVSDSFEVAQPLSLTPSDAVDVLETCIQMFSHPSNPTDSASNSIFSSSPPENLNQMSLTKCQLNSSQSTLSEFIPALPSTYNLITSTLSQPEQSNSAPGSLSQFADSPVLLDFEDSSSAGSVDLETSLYTADSNNGQSDKEEMESGQSDYTDLLPLSLHSEAEATIYETVTYAQHDAKHQTQNEYFQNVTKNLINGQPQSNLMRGSGGVRCLSRDEQRARALGLPLSVHDIINLPVDAFNETVNSKKLSHAQLTLIRDIRRRGKNKMAAQSCRKRKLDSLFDLEDEIEGLKKEKDQRKEEKERNARDLCETKEKLRKLYNEVFRQLRDEHGNLYNPKEYTLQHSTDGMVYLLPRNTGNKTNTMTQDLL
ncbi:endoplasmic reticulum membrane sensor NFE2L1-like [Myxocyprinus asiaticus]|uniref:endoplasmic reticulum membrane sensor NFE2L1-like n=1 Tax=Myxocyprinus asiaticus TaxID=70543 RepID=UPI002222C9CE|nr:endoplasmic reticulum membrane sensor NFE2L1-like [Myxocyprinus asiaticus]